MSTTGTFGMETGTNGTTLPGTSRNGPTKKHLKKNEVIPAYETG
jgi:hypothetical protein